MVPGVLPSQRLRALIEKDRYGLSWQVTPANLVDMMADPDRAKARRAADAMLKMVKLDFAALQQAFDGR